MTVHTTPTLRSPLTIQGTSQHTSQDFRTSTLSTPAAPLDQVATYDFPEAMLARLQAEQRWSTDFTLQAVNEYRRFVQLAALAPHPVTPSQVVDEVWHTHLMFTRDYWDRFMALLPAPLHHEPGDGTPSDQAHFAEQYLQTLDAYRVLFGQEPPRDVWPDPTQPTSSAPNPSANKQVNDRWVKGRASRRVGFPVPILHKPLLPTPLLYLLPILLGGLVALLSGWSLLAMIVGVASFLLLVSVQSAQATPPQDGHKRNNAAGGTNHSGGTGGGSCGSSHHQGRGGDESGQDGHGHDGHGSGSNCSGSSDSGGSTCSGGCGGGCSS